MLRKLLRYEMQAMRRTMLPLYAVLIAVSVLFGVTVRTTQSDPFEESFFSGVGNTLTGVSGTLYGTAIFVVAIGTLILVIQRFRKNLMGDEGYLMMTLPVGVGTHISNKTISATIWMVIGVVISIVSVLILVAIFDPIDFLIAMQQLSKAFLSLSSAEMVKVVIILVEAIVIALLITAESVVKIYAAIAVGHQWNKHRTFGAILAYIGFGVVEIILANVVDELNIPNWLTEKFYAIAGGENIYIGEYGLTASAPHSFAAFQFAFGITAAVILVGIVIYGFITYRMMDRRLNLQ